MKNMIATLTLVAALAVVPAVQAETVDCPSSQYGGVTCGVSTTTETVEHKTQNLGVADNQLFQILLIAGASAVAATVLYKLSYRWYIFD